MKESRKNVLIPLLTGVLLLAVEGLVTFKFQPVISVLVYTMVYGIAAYGLVKRYGRYDVAAWFQLGVCGSLILFMPLTLLFFPKSPYHFIAMYAALLNWLVITGVCIILKFVTDKYSDFKLFFRLSSLIFSLLYLPVVGYALFFKTIGVSGFNGVPFSTITAYTTGKDKYLGGAMLNIIANILLFIPLGFYTGVLWKKRKRMKKLMVILFIPILVELIQWVFSLGIVDVDDVILNALGGLSGLLILKVIEKFYSLVKKDDKAGLFLIRCLTYDRRNMIAFPIIPAS